MTSVDRPPPPAPDPATPCAWGCKRRLDSTGWRWVRATGEWLRVCWLHAASSKAADYIDDTDPRTNHADDTAGERETHQEELWT